MLDESFGFPLTTDLYLKEDESVIQTPVIDKKNFIPKIYTYDYVRMGDVFISNHELNDWRKIQTYVSFENNS